MLSVHGWGSGVRNNSVIKISPSTGETWAGVIDFSWDRYMKYYIDSLNEMVDDMIMRLLHGVELPNISPNIDNILK